MKKTDSKFVEIGIIKMKKITYLYLHYPGMSGNKIVIEIDKIEKKLLKENFLLK